MTGKLQQRNTNKSREGGVNRRWKVEYHLLIAVCLKFGEE